MQNDQGKSKNNLADRLLNYAVAVVRLCGQLRKSYEGRHIAQQLFRSATSAGANYEEAQAAESRADFLHRLQVSLKELKESRYWLRLTQRLGMGPQDCVDELAAGSNELALIYGQSVLTAKGQRRRVSSAPPDAR